MLASCPNYPQSRVPLAFMQLVRVIDCQSIQPQNVPHTSTSVDTADLLEQVLQLDDVCSPNRSFFGAVFAPASPSRKWLSLAARHGTRIYGISFSPDGRELAAAFIDCSRPLVTRVILPRSANSARWKTRRPIHNPSSCQGLRPTLSRRWGALLCPECKLRSVRSDCKTTRKSSAPYFALATQKEPHARTRSFCHKCLRHGSFDDRFTSSQCALFCIATAIRPTWRAQEVIVRRSDDLLRWPT